MNPSRARKLNNKPDTKGPIIYWMSRDQRVEDNWALLFAQELAEKQKTSFAVVFCLREQFSDATERLIDFMLRGLIEVEETLHKKNVPFYFLFGDPKEKISQFLKEQKAGALISDFSPLRYNRQWKEALVKELEIPFYEVDAHNIVPVWIASDKQQYGAYTLRPKIQKLLPIYLENFPKVTTQLYSWHAPIKSIDWAMVRKRVVINNSAAAVNWITPGEKAAHAMLKTFIDTKLPLYHDKRNDPTADIQSNLSPFLHFGHIASERVALSIRESEVNYINKETFLEELIIRKELSDNYCFYNPDYDNPKGFPQWAIKTHADHAYDKREWTYSLNQLEAAETHDPLWNAAQREMLNRGKMFGYLRMYWAKKIFEWSPNVQTAQQYAIYLNDTYFLDGRDPNGYTGIAWSMGGVHDRPWFERAIFGQIRYMSYNGAKSKFAIEDYIQSV